MMLKKYMASFLSAVMLWGALPVFAAEVENPGCVMLKFDDATRFAKVDTAGTLSELIMEKLWKQIWLRLYMRIDWLNSRQIKRL